MVSSGQLNLQLSQSVILNNPIEGDQGTSGNSTLTGGLNQMVLLLSV